MRLLYRVDTGDVLYAVTEAAWPTFTHTTHVALGTFAIDEVDANQLLCADLVQMQGVVNAVGLPKYYVAGGTALMAREAWVRRTP